MTNTPTPQQLEGSDVETFTIDYNGLTLTFPVDLDEVDGDVMDAVDDGKMSHALRGLLGDSQWAAFKATKPKVKDYNALFDLFAQAAGLGSAGESVASSGS
jgi:hypothetical protein